jgi:hypothetical protein
MSRPLIQIGDEIREMNEEEHANYLKIIEDANEILSTDSPSS